MVGPAPAKPPVVTPPDPAALVATPDRTVVTRRPRASHKPSEPHELMPTLRMPPVEARALRRQASGSPEAESEAVALGSGEIEIEASAPVAPVTEAPVVEATPVVDATTPSPATDAREVQPTVRVAAIPVENTSVGAMPKPKLHRPPLPLPDVLRNGPRPPSRSERVAEPPVAEPPSDRAPVFAAPDSIPVIDTASLVLEMAESLTAEPAPAPNEADAAIDVETSEPDVAVLPAPTVAPRAVNPTIPLESIDLETIDDEQPASRRRSIVPIAIGVAASIAALVWWLVPPSRDAAQVDPAFAPLGEQLAFVAENTPEPEPIAEVVPPPPPTPAIDIPTTPPPTALLGEAAGDLIADAVLPTPGVAEEVAAEEAVIEVDEAPVAAPAPAPAAAPKPKPTAHKKSKSHAKSKSKPKPEPKVGAAAPPPPAKTSAASLDPTALLREAEKAYAEGRYGTALRQAQRSLAGRNDPRATRIIALSACKLKRESVAKNAFDRLPLGQRRGVKNTCKDAGIKL